ncbi:TOBE domain-containing protein [Alcaligenaceae bacterium CGII-47]|nr:TOBE domain-containing protein [Alcaligenaceae bacterium CGII-47]
MTSKPAFSPVRPELTSSITLRSQDQNWGTQRRLALLEAIGTEGSITAAAKKIGLSYKAAWDAIDTMNNLADSPLVLRTTGGKRGGGASLTPRAQELITWYNAIRHEHQRFLDLLTRLDPNTPKNLELLQHMMVQTSARNRLMGTISHIVTGAVNDEITLQTAEGVTIVATITQASTLKLNLVIGRRILAFIKAPSVIIGLPGCGMTLSARNQLPGTIAHIAQGAVQAEVGIDLGVSTRITALLSLESLRVMKLTLGQPAYAIFKSSSVLLGTLD